MLKVYRVNPRTCALEFGTLSFKRTKINILKGIVDCFDAVRTTYGGYISGIDFNVQKAMDSIHAESLFYETLEGGTATGYFASNDIMDLYNVMGFFDCFSEGTFSLYMMPFAEQPIDSRDSLVHLFGKSKACISVYSDATYIEIACSSEEYANLVFASLNKIRQRH